MSTFIGSEEITLLCGAPKYDGKYANGAQTCYSKDTNQQGESKSKPSKWSVFKGKSKIFWGEVKKAVLGLADVLGTVTVFAKAVTGVIKISKKKKEAFA